MVELLILEALYSPTPVELLNQLWRLACSNLCGLLEGVTLRSNEFVDVEDADVRPSCLRLCP